MFDLRNALADMAIQIRSCRIEDGLTLQELASRSRVAASTIHKIEARQMVPTVSVLLKIAKGLERRPAELVRDTLASESDSFEEAPDGSDGAALDAEVGVWRIDLAAQEFLPALELGPLQRAIVLLEKGALNLHAGQRHVVMDAGDCLAVEGGRIESPFAQLDAASLTLIVSPRGDLDRRLGSPSESTPIFQ